MAGSVEPDPPKRGRPPGEVTPEALIRQELISHLKDYRRTRQIVEKRLSESGESMSLEDLGKIMDLLRKGVVEMAKPIVAPAKAEAAKETVDEDPQKLLDKLLAGG